MSTDVLGWMKLQQLQPCARWTWSEEVYFLCSYDYFMYQPEHNFCSLLCFKKFYFSGQILIHKVIRNSHMVLSLHVFV